MKLWKFLRFVALILMLTACSRINTKIIAEAAINPDIQHLPSPVAIHIFELTNPLYFEGADFLALYQQPEKNLHGTLLYEQRVVVSPGSAILMHLPYVSGAKFLGFIAAFRNAQSVIWQAVMPMGPMPLWGQRFVLNINTAGISVTKD